MLSKGGICDLLTVWQIISINSGRKLLFMNTDVGSSDL